MSESVKMIQMRFVWFPYLRIIGFSVLRSMLQQPSVVMVNFLMMVWDLSTESVTHLYSWELRNVNVRHYWNISSMARPTSRWACWETDSRQASQTVSYQMCRHTNLYNDLPSSCRIHWSRNSRISHPPRSPARLLTAITGRCLAVENDGKRLWKSECTLKVWLNTLSR